MQQIKMTPEMLRQQSTVYRNGSQTIMELLQQLQQVQMEMGEQWSGAAWQSFSDQYEQLRPKVQSFSDLLGSIESQLQQVAATVEHFDQEIARNIMSQ
jgi:WXG100 family type VII secretion target